MFVSFPAGESFGIVFCSLVYAPGISVSIANCLLTWFTIMAGVFAITIPTWLLRINYVSILRYGIRILARHEFGDLTFHCSDSQRVSPSSSAVDVRCPFSTGSEVIALYDFGSDSDLADLLAIGALTVAYRAIAYLTLRWAANQRHFAA